MTKKVLSLSLLLALTIVFQAKAQVLTVAPANPAQPKNNVQQAQNPNLIDAADNQIWWGYFNGTEERNAVGIQKKEIHDAAIFISGDNKIAAGRAIKAIRVYLRDIENLSSVKVWLSKKLPSTADKADIFVKTLDLSTLQGDDQGDNLGSPNDIALDNPYTITGEGVYVGYSIGIKELTDKTKYPLVTTKKTHNYANSFFIKTGVSIKTWQDYSLRYLGALCTQVLLEGDFYDTAATPSDCFFPLATPNQSFSSTTNITNCGKEDISSIAYHISRNGVAGEEKTVNFTSPITPGISQGVQFNLTAPETYGTEKNLFVITKVNGKDNQAEVNSSNVSITIIQELDEKLEKNVLVEEFTTEMCGNCPAAANAIASYLKNNPDIAKKVAMICHHSGYYTDKFTTDADVEYEWFYNSNTYAPAFMYDRAVISSTNTPVEHAGNYGSNINKMLQKEAPVSVEVKAELKDEKVEVTVTGKVVKRFGNTIPHMTVTLVEDNIATGTQSGGGTSYKQQHVTRAVNNTWGTPFHWDNNNYTYTYTFDLNPSWNKEELSVVAFISDIDRTNPTKCLVYNCNKAKVDLATGITDLTEKAGDKTEVARYTIDGQRIYAPQRGVNIVKLSDGTTQKVMVK